MKKKYIPYMVFVIIIVLLIIGSMIKPSKYMEGNIVSDFKLESIEGEEIGLYEFQTSIILIEFFRTDTVTNNKKEELFQKKGKFAGIEPYKKINPAQTAFTNTQYIDMMIDPNADITFLSINVGEDKKTVTDFVNKCKKKWYVLLDKDKKIYEKFFNNYFPGYIVLDKDKRIIYKIGGWSGLIVSILVNVLKENGIVFQK